MSVHSKRIAKNYNTQQKHDCVLRCKSGYLYTCKTSLKMRKKISASIIAKIAIETINVLKSINDIATIYEMHPNQVSQ